MQTSPRRVKQAAGVFHPTIDEFDISETTKRHLRTRGIATLFPIQVGVVFLVLWPAMSCDEDCRLIYVYPMNVGGYTLLQRGARFKTTP